MHRVTAAGPAGAIIGSKRSTLATTASSALGSNAVPGDAKSLTGAMSGTAEARNRCGRSPGRVADAIREWLEGGMDPDDIAEMIGREGQLDLRLRGRSSVSFSETNGGGIGVAAMGEAVVIEI